jgi:hypothetical protein
MLRARMDSRDLNGEINYYNLLRMRIFYLLGRIALDHLQV